ncbi:MFS transporter [Aeromicrobium ponti]|uniref:Putative MFS family arabinose efflux permease n=1 Tax=Cytobacillus oceanisediminis TaxID=665099 RepID=A0A562J947_9BACI|nr:MFS transporter [Cytobacillus oceanisediminis]TWH79657.1 putative MFS family arabinose efflux permease [Cytobacillus oceanisediminis]
MIKKRLDRYLVFMCTCLFTVSIAGSRPLIPLYAKQLGAENIHIGVIIALFSMLPLLLSVKTGTVIDYIGVKKPLIFSIVIGSISMLILSISRDYIGIYISQIFAGFAHLVFVLSIQSYAGHFSKNKLREYYIAIFSIAVASGSFAGPVISGFLTDTISYSYAFLVLGLIILIALPLSWLFHEIQIKAPKSIEPHEKAEKAFRLLQDSHLRKAILISSLVLLVKDAYIAFFPLLAAEKGVSTSVIGVIISLNAAAGILIRSILPWIVQRYKRKMIIIISIIMAGIIYMINPFVDHVIWLCILGFILGFCSGIGQPLSIFVTIIALPKDRIAEGLGLRLMFNKVTQVVAPLSLGAVSGVVGMSGVFYLCGAVILAGGIQPCKSLFYKKYKR